jgi:hypothetical protein
MFTLNNVTLRPLEFSDREHIYVWMSALEHNLFGGWMPPISVPLSRDAFAPLFEQQFVNVQRRDDLQADALEE